MKWTKEEETLLINKGYLVYGCYASKNDITLEKEDKNGTIYYNKGISSTAIDIDGDSGWCRTWSFYKTLNECLQ